MNVQTDMKPARPGDCGCGCGGKCGCESRCCELECLVRPNFFCGQLLTDADLGAMVDWARTRFGLTRYRHGWGAVCGLDVTCCNPQGGDDCCPDPGKGPRVYVNPGYAIDCCGNDLVVCEPIAVDLSAVCQPSDDPCDPPAKPRPADPRKTNAAPAAGTPARQAIIDEPADCWNMFDDGIVAVDLTLRYHEDLAQGQRAMFRSGRSDTGPCEYSRVLEHPGVHAELGDLNDDYDVDYDVWDKEFTIRRDRARAEMETALKQGLEGVLKYLRRHPPYKFCFIEQVVCCLLQQADPADKKTLQRLGDAWRDRVYVWIYVDWLMHELECPCWSCKPDGGVPLARVLLKRVLVQGTYTCRVLFIDTSVPHRRPLQKERCRPIRRGAIDLAPYLWQSGRYVRESLGALGVNVMEVSGRSETEILGRLDQASLIHEVDAARELYAWVVKDPFNRDRVAAFATADHK